MTKSILHGVNLGIGIGNVCNIPVGKDVESLVLLQTSRAEINLLAETHSLGHQTKANKV